jgi:hypothetical protein
MVDYAEVVLSQSNADSVVVLGGSMSIAFKRATAGLHTHAAPSLANLFEDYAAVYAFLETEAKQLPGRAEAAGIAAAFVRSAEEHGVATNRVMVGLRDGPCYFTDRTNTPTLGQGEWVRIEGTGTEKRPAWDFRALTGFLDSLDAKDSTTGGPTDGRPPTAIYVTAGATAALRQERAEQLNAVVNEWHEDDGKEEPSPYWFRALRPAEEAFAILKTVVAANTRSTRGLGFSCSHNTRAKLVLPGKIVYGFSGSESAVVAAAPGPGPAAAAALTLPLRIDHPHWRPRHQAALACHVGRRERHGQSQRRLRGRAHRLRARRQRIDDHLHKRRLPRGRQGRVLKTTSTGAHSRGVARRSTFSNAGIPSGVLDPRLGRRCTHPRSCTVCVS